MLKDLRVVFRGFGRAPAPTVLIVLTLGLALGANAATFSLIDRVALRPLSVDKPHEIVMVNAWPLPYPCPCLMLPGGRARGMPYPLFQSLRAGLSRPFSAMAAYRDQQLTLAGEPSAVEISGQLVSGDYFRVFGLHALTGRTLSSVDDDQRESPAIAVLNYGFWMRQFGGDRSIVNRTIRLNNVPFTVVGVLTAGYTGTTVGRGPDVFVPVGMGRELMPSGLPKTSVIAWDSRNFSAYNAIARLAPGVSSDAAERALRVLYQHLWDDVVATTGVKLTPKDLDVYRNRPPEVIPAGTIGSSQSVPQRKLEVPLRLLFAMTVLVLLIGAGNVANLLAAAGARRGREMAVSLALGAGRWDLLRPRLVEALMLAILSGGAGLLLAAWFGQLMPLLLGMTEELAGINTQPDGRVVVFTTTMSLVTGVLIWLASALLVTRRSTLPGLHARSGSGTAGRPGATLRRALVIVQVSLSFALVSTAVLLGRSLVNVLSVDPGFDAERVVGFTVNPRAAGYEGERVEQYMSALADRARALPGVSRVALSSVMPLSGSRSSREIAGPRQQAGHAATEFVDVVSVSPDYFATIGLELVRGRAFDDHDVRTAPGVVIANEAAVRLLVDGSDVLGQRIGEAWEIVGVVRDGRNGLKTPAQPTLYRPQAQTNGAGPIVVLLRMPANKIVPAAAVADIVKQLDPGVAMSTFGSLGALARDALLRERMLAALSLVFASLAALLAAMGLAGLTSVNVARRTREIGIRLALGASPSSVEWLMLREATLLAGAGLVAGLALFLSANRVLRSLLFEISPYDPGTIVLAICALGAISAVGGLLPARRAARIDPAITLKCD